MIGDAYKIKYSDYVLNLDGTDNGRFIEIEATDYTSRPGINTTNLNHSNPAKRVPLDIVLYGYRSRGYGAPLWNNLFYLLENFAQPSEDTSIFPKYDKNPTVGQIWVDTSFEPAVPRWYGRDNAFYKLGASVNIAANASQAAPGELWFDTSVYAFKFYDTGWSDISCIPYASQREYNTLATLANALTTIPGTLPILTGSAKPTPTLWGSLITVVRLLAQANGALAPTAAVDILAADNFMICNAGVYGVASIKSIFSQIRTSIDAIEAAVNPPTQLPLAGFIPSSTTGTAPMVVNFTDTSTQTTVSSQDAFGPTQYTWDFGDGTTSTTPGNVSHTYTIAGSRTVTLTLVNSVGTTSTQSVINIVGAPVAQFLVGPDTNPDVSATAPFALMFTDQSAGSPTSWLWNFGDGNISSERNPSHTYSTLGDFTVSLLVTNAAGSNTATVTHAVQVGEPTIANFTYTTPTRPTSDTSPFSVTFTDTTTKLPTSWLWDFGDGATSTQQNPTHTYTSWGRFTVTLTATNVLSNTALDVGQTSVKTMVDLVNIGLAPTSAFTLSSSVGSLPITVTATDASTNAPTSWLWDFGDGSPVVNTQQASHVYTSYGTRTVTLIATNIVGSHTSTQSIVVTPPAVVTSFGHQTDGNTVPVTVTYTDTSSNSPTSWLWNFGDGTTSTQQNPTHTYTNPGTYTTTLTASNYAGGNSNSVAVTANQRTVYVAINSSITNFNVANNVSSSMHGAGVTISGDGYVSGQTNIVVTIDSAAVVGSVGFTSPAFSTGSTWNQYDSLTLINNGMIVGRGGESGTASGGAGGPALVVEHPITITNNGIIGGGGGAGGAGGGGYHTYSSGKTTTDGYSVGGGGGGGAGYNPGSGGPTAGTGTSLYNYYRNAAAGTQGSTTTGGSGGLGSYGHVDVVSPSSYIVGGAGGNGGSLGAVGGSGQAAIWASESGGSGIATAAPAPAAGGGGGTAVVGDALVTWITTGTRLGTII